MLRARLESLPRGLSPRRRLVSSCHCWLRLPTWAFSAGLLVALLIGGCGARVVPTAALGVGPAGTPEQQELSGASEAPALVSPEIAAVADPTVSAPAVIPSPSPRAPAQSPELDLPAFGTTSCDWRAELDRAVAGRPARWIVRDTGAWGRAQVPGDRIWIARRTPCDKVFSVAVHEWVHHMQGIVYRDWGTVVRELAPYGGPEVVADCGALILGATWIHYGCPGQTAHAAAAAIIDGRRPTIPSAD